MVELQGAAGEFYSLAKIPVHVLSSSLHVMSQIVEILSAHTLNFQVQVHKDKLKYTWVQRVFGVKCNKQKNQGVNCATDLALPFMSANHAPLSNKIKPFIAKSSIPIIQNLLARTRAL